MNHKKTFMCLALALFSVEGIAAPTQADKDLAAAQAALNKEVLSRPFSTEDYQSVEVYIQDRHSRGIKPAPRWRPHDDCELLTDIGDYRDCQYYKRYYAD
ncbi:MAG TPA: hypothetical protein PK129_09385 [Cellvibrionaceae bacterium]|nr:hypothetical protein [Cellvibrionaceae bacterium]